MAEIEFIGKSLMITGGGESVLVVSDLHLGYGESLRKSGVFVPEKIHEETMQDFERIFEKIGKRKIDKIIILGDLKHVFGRILRGERDEINSLFGFLEKRCGKIIVVRGNHDVLMDFMGVGKKIEIVNYYLWGEFAFVHGDRDFKEIYGRKIKTWVMGHMHPAVVLREGVKSEKYKCFLLGKHAEKDVVILPSFFPAAEGTDPRGFKKEMLWKFNLRKFGVWVVGERVGGGLKALDFGKLGKLN